MLYGKQIFYEYKDLRFLKKRKKKNGMFTPK